MTQDSKAPSSGMPAAAVESARLTPEQECLQLMALAVQRAGMYGVRHPSTRDAVSQWYKRLGSLLRKYGEYTIGTDGRVASINNDTFSTNNPIIHELLKRLHSVRSGELKLMAGFEEAHASGMAAFLAEADATHLADDEKALESWVERNRVRHVRVARLQLREIKEGDRVVSGDTHRSRPTPAARKRGRKTREDPREAEKWSKTFQSESDRAGGPAIIPAPVRDGVVAHLRGKEDADADAAPEQMMRAAENSVQLAGLILKVALVQQELMQRANEPVGNDVVTCLRSVVETMQRGPDAKAGDRWASLARILAKIEEELLGQLQTMAGGTDRDAEIIREGVLELHRYLEGEALKQEYEQRRSALQTVERKLKRFFGAAESAEASGG